jgi:Protein of unknown function (DUF2865)
MPSNGACVWSSAVILIRQNAHARAIILLAGLLAMAPAPAGAEGLFDFMFGGARRPAPPPSASSYSDPRGGHSYGGQPSQRAAEPALEAGPSVSYCVRLCDGRYYPLQRTSNSNPVKTCSAFCPAARTKVFSGSEINTATANDGSRYKELPNAFVYRDRTVADCTCNGKDAYGLVTAEAKDDPTLRPGDIVATDRGFVAYNGSSRRSKEFTPIASYGGLPSELRHKLAGAKIEPRSKVVRPAPAEASSGTDQRAQLDK